MSPSTKPIRLASIAVLLTASAVYSVHLINVDELRHTLRDDINTTSLSLLGVTLGVPAFENVEASIVTRLFNEKPFIRQIALIAKHKKPDHRTAEEIEALVYYYFATFNLPEAETGLVDPLVGERKALVETALVTESGKVVSIKEFSEEESRRQLRQKDAADAILTALRKSVLAAAYLHERAGRRALAVRYYAFYVRIAKRLAVHFNYFGSPFTQDLLTVAQFKLDFLQHAVSAFRSEYADRSYFNMVIERSAESVFKHAVFDRYRQHGWLGGRWDKKRSVEVGNGTMEEERYTEFEPALLAKLADDIDIKDDPFLFFEVCASIWANADGTEQKEESLCPLSQLSAIAVKSPSPFVASLSLYLNLRASQVRTFRRSWDDNGLKEAELERIIQSIDSRVIADWLRDDLAYILFFEKYEENFKRGKLPFLAVFPFGQFDATPAILELD